MALDARCVDRGREHAEVHRRDQPDEHPEHEDELALVLQIRLARLVDQLRDLAHRRVHRQVLETAIDHHSEQKTEHADDQARHQ